MDFKYLKLIFFAFLLVLFSCTKDCEDEGFGSVKVTNNSQEWYEFDIVNRQDDNNQWIKSEPRIILANGDFEWKEIDVGTWYIIAGDGVYIPNPIVVDTVDVFECEQVSVASVIDSFVPIQY